MQKIVAPAKIILFGEHSIVYPGNSAVLSTIGLNTTCTASKSINKDGKINFQFKYQGKIENIIVDISIAKINYSQAMSFKNEYLITNDFSKLSKFMSLDWGAYYVLIGKIASTIDLTPMNIIVEIDIPIGSGMGSSASITSSITKAIYKELGKDISNENLFNITKEVEDFQHGRSSGADPAAIINGGVILYKHSLKGEKTFEKLSPKNKWSKDLILINSGKPIETTGEMVSKVRDLYVKDNGKYNDLFLKINNISIKFSDNKYYDIADLINENGLLLEQVGVVSQKVIEFSRKIREKGGAIKVCGAGGISNNDSGILICKINNKKYIDKLIKEYGYQIIKGEFGVNGVK